MINLPPSLVLAQPAWHISYCIAFLFTSFYYLPGEDVPKQALAGSAVPATRVRKLSAPMGNDAARNNWCCRISILHVRVRGKCSDCCVYVCFRSRLISKLYDRGDQIVAVDVVLCYT